MFWQTITVINTLRTRLPPNKIAGTRPFTYRGKSFM